METPEILPWRESVKKKLIGLWMADRTAGMAQVLRHSQLVERLVRKTQDGTLGKPGAESQEMGDIDIRIGDDIHHHKSPTAEKPGMSTLGKLAAGAALVATGAGAAVGVPLIADALRSEPPAVVQPAQDADRVYDLEIFRPEQQP